MNRSNIARAILAAAALSATPALAADFNWIANGTAATPALWATGTNWQPAGPPTASDTAIFQTWFGQTGDVVVDIGGTRTVDTIRFSSSFTFTIGTTTAPGILNVNAIDAGFNGVPDSPSFTINLNGYSRINSQVISPNLNVTGSGGIITLANANNNIGNMTVTNATVAFLSTPGSLGTTGTATITLDGGGLRNEGGAAATIGASRSFVIGTNGALFDARNSMTLSGTVSGSGALVKSGLNQLTLSGNNTGYTGAVTVLQGNVSLGTAGTLTNITSLDTAAAFFMTYSTGTAANRLSDTAGITLRGSQFTLAMNQSGGVLTETIGDITLNGGNQTSLSINSGGGATGANVALTIGNLTRLNGATMMLRGENFGTSATGRRVLFKSGAGVAAGELIGGGGGTGTTTRSIVPWIYGFNGAQINGFGNTFVTIDPTTGLRPLALTTEYAIDTLNTAGATENARLTTGVALGGNTTVNSLYLGQSAASQSYSVTGAGTLTVTSGAVMFGDTSGVSTTGGTVTLDGPTLDFGSREGLLYVMKGDGTGTGAGRLIVLGSSDITGTGGLTKSGIAQLEINGAKSFSGRVNIMSGITFAKGNVLANLAGPLGNSNDPVALNATGSNSTARLYVGTGSGDAEISRPILVQTSTTNTALIGTTTANETLRLSGTITLADANSTLYLDGSSGGSATVISGNIVGAGAISTQNLGFAAPQVSKNTDLIITSSNPGFTGVIEPEFDLGLGADDALGTATIQSLSGTTRISSYGAARTIANDMLVYGTITFGDTFDFDPAFAASNLPLTLTGDISMTGSRLGLRVNNSVTTILGSIFAGSFNKFGVGRLDLSNTAGGMIGTVQVAEGVLRLTVGGEVLGIIGSASASVFPFTASSPNPSVPAEATLELAAGIGTVNKTMRLQGAGVGGLGGIRSLGGDNTISGFQGLISGTRAGFTEAQLRPTYGVDSGSLTLLGQLFNSGTDASVNLGKVGAGSLVLDFDRTIDVDGNVIPGTFFIDGGNVTITTRNDTTANRVLSAAGTTLTIQGAGKLVLAASGTGIEGDVTGTGSNGGTGGTVGVGSTSVIRGLSIAGTLGAWTATLDIKNNDVVLLVTNNTIDEVRDQVSFAYNGGLWDRPGITSSNAAGDGLAVGFGANVDLGYTVFSGVDTSAGDEFFVKYTWFGDANLDGQVDGDDYLLWLAVFGSSGPGIGWGQGDFDYDADVDGDDYLLWLQNFGNGIGSPLSAVPEPGVLGLAAVAGMGLIARRRRAAR